MKEKYIFFDLDGTLSDSAPGITMSAAYALEKLGIHENPDNLGFFVGPPLTETFRESYGLNEREIDTALKYFRERYSTKGIFENTPYDGVEQLLQGLCRAGKKLILATSKPEHYAREIIKRYGFEKYFIFMGGAGMDEKTRIRKDEVLEYCLCECKIKDTSECIMVGDRHHDVEGAEKFGIPTVGVLYGYGSKEELLSAGAIEVFETPELLCKYLLRQ